MKKGIYRALIPIIGVIIGCTETTVQDNSLTAKIAAERIGGTEEYINSPYVAAGNRVYVVGHQDGTFPDLGWHVTDEMGGIWDHPIKLMDGFQAQLIIDGDSVCLDRATNFNNYPFGNEFSYDLGDIHVNRFQFVPDDQEGFVVEFVIKNTGLSSQVGFVFTGLIDLMPVWLSERQGISDGKDEARYNQVNEAIIAKDKENDWYVAFGADRRPDFHGIGGNPCEAKNKGNGTRGSLKYEMTIESGHTEIIQFFVGGSYHSVDTLWSNYNEIKQNYEDHFESKTSRYEGIAGASKLESNDAGFDQMYRWIKYNTDWLIRDVPEIGSGLSAGIPDYPWWFGTDNTYAIQGMLASGMHKESLATIKLIFDISRGVNKKSGQIMHETSTNGEVFNPGNLNTTPNFITALWKAFAWTGDKTIIDDYYEDVKRGIEWIESMDTDGNGYPDGPGMMEIHGLHSEMIDVVVYQAAAYKAAGNFAEFVGDNELAEQYSRKAEDLRRKINLEWWVQDFNSYADFRASKTQAIELIEAAIVRADTIDKPWSIKELETSLKKVMYQPSNDDLSGYVVHHNWVVNTPMEMKLADPLKADAALNTARNYRNRFGMYVTGMDRDESQEKAEKWQAFSYVGAVMTLPTGVQAIAELNYGNADEALEYLKMLENSFSYALPGSMYEVSPDYGMIAQAWNIYALGVPIVEHFFGVQPKAYEEKIVLKPNLPSDWREVSLSDVKVGDNNLTIKKSTDENIETFTISQTMAGWNIEFFPGSASAVYLNEELVSSIDESELVAKFSGNENVIRIER